MKKWIIPIILALVIIAIVAVTLIRKPEKAPVVVATMLDSEGSVLGKMIVQLLEQNDIKVTDKVNFGTPDILRKALENKEVDLIVDYTGSGQYYHPDEATDTSIWSDPVKGYEFTAKLDKDKLNIIWLTPAQANNTEMIAVKREFAESNGIVSMADFAAYVNAGKETKLICAASFAENPLGLLGYEKAYNFKLTEKQLVILSSGNTAEMLKALSEGTSGINASLVYGTDGALDKMNLVVLEDPLHVPPVYLPAPVIRGDVLDEYPEIADILKPVFESLTLEKLQKLNSQVAYDGKDGAEVARDYLKANGF
jgi:osmoprotectant transport system substrate-binding protein